MASAGLRPRGQQRLGPEDWLMRSFVLLFTLYLLTFVLLPLFEVTRRSFLDRSGAFIGLQNYVTYFATPSLSASLGNSLFISILSMLITVTLAFAFAYALTRTAMTGKGVFRTLAMLPLFAPSILHAVAFIYLFGRQGLLTRGFFGNLPFLSFDIGLYQSPTGIILAEVFYLFPHALLILIVGLSVADARLFEVAKVLGTSPLRTFLTVTLPSVRYSLVSAAFVCFTLVFTDFGIPKVIGGNYDVLATSIYQQVIGQQNFVMGATVGVILLLPAVLGFAVDRLMQRRQGSSLAARSVLFVPQPNPRLDRLLFGYCTLITFAILSVLGTALFASLVRYWPYDLSLGLGNYDFSRVAGAGSGAYRNSLVMASLTALVGTVVAFLTAYFVEKGKGMAHLRGFLYFLSTLPVALPGLVLGLAYIFFFNSPNNPLNFLYGTLAILALSSVTHFFTVSFFTATSALKQIDGEFEAVSASLKMPFWQTLWRVTIPVALPAILEVAVYFFVNAMTTVSAVIFLYSASTQLAAVSIVSMDDAGQTAAAAAMSMAVFATGLSARVLYELVSRVLLRRTQVWRQR